MIEFDNVKIFTDNIDYSALNQLHELVKTGIFVDMPIRIMPDVHTGVGCVIGFTAPVADKIIPNLVGVDIGCGMLCVELGKIEIDFTALDNAIRKYVPSGKNVGTFSAEASELIGKLRCFKHLKKKDWLESSLGTLGGGNHFIEIDEDEDNCKYLVIHSGSRNVGKQVAEYYQGVAIKSRHHVDASGVITELRSQGRDKEISERIAELKKSPVLPNELCYLCGDSFDDYMHDMQICTEFADKNREMMANVLIRKVFSGVAHERFTTRHNYISKDNYIRKGAISAKTGERVLIPLNMRDGCIIGVGKGNADWNYSAPHGAGRVMSRAQAKQTLKIEDFRVAMSEVYSTTVSEGTLDEAPFAYKPSQEIISLTEDTVEIEKIIKPIYNYKAND